VGADRVEPPGPGVPLTILDTGLDATHAEFASRPDTTLLNDQTVDGAREFHGTAVASVAAAAANGTGVVGAYPTARLLSWDASRDGRQTSGDVVAGLEAAAARGRGVVNISLGGPRSQLEAEAVANAFARGVIVVTASGNEGRNGSPPSYPANLPHVVTVGASGHDDEVLAFSSRSAALDVVAPGTDIPVAVPFSYYPDGYSVAGGTSFASPIVAAAIAWVWTVRPALERTQVLELVRRAARDLQPSGRDVASGFGLLDLPRMLTLPAPALDPNEPNDSVDQVVGTASFPVARQPLTTPSRGRSTLAGRLDVADDPRDVYRVWLPGRRRVTVTARSSAAVELTLLGTRPRTVSWGRRTAGTTRTLTATNRARKGVWLYVSAFMRLGTEPSYADYTLAVTTARAPARR